MSEHSVGFIGLGAMGSGMALNLARALETLHVHDPEASAMQPLTEAGASACTSAADLAGKCDTVLLCLPFAPEVRDVIFGEDGLVGGDSVVTSIIDTTTLDRTDAIAIGQQCAEHGISYCDAPISGLPKRAADGSLTIMVGGTDEAFAHARPLLDHCGSDIIHCGAVGAGQAMKAINNIIYNINIVALCEVLPLAVAAGLDPGQLASLVTSGSSRSFASEHFVPRIMEGRFADDFPMQSAYKDIVNVQRMAIETRAMTPVVNAMVATYQATMAAGHGPEPKSAMIKTYEKALGVAVREAKG